MTQHEKEKAGQAPASVAGDYLGMPLHISALDVENLEYFRHCAEGRLHLQRCSACGLLRYPPTTACPWCASFESTWDPVEGRGVVYSYSEVRHAIQPAFRAHLPYLLLLVELDIQRGQPTPEQALRLNGNLVGPDGKLAPPDLVRTVGIGTRVRMVFTPVGPSLAVPQWTIDESAAQPDRPWRYPE
jgi:uncharacterized OB-fold protein